MIFPGGTTPSFFWSYWFSKNHNSSRGCDTGVVPMWSCLLFRGDHSRCVGGATPILFWEVADREHFSLVYVTQKPKHVHWWFYHHCVWFELGDPSWVGALCNLSDISWGNHSLIFLIILIKKIITLQGWVVSQSQLLFPVLSWFLIHERTGYFCSQPRCKKTCNISSLLASWWKTAMARGIARFENRLFFIHTNICLW